MTGFSGNRQPSAEDQIDKPAEPNREREPGESGTVYSWNEEEGYGFIVPEHGSKHVFVHRIAVEKAGLKNLTEGQRVKYDVEPDRTGRLHAVNLRAT